ncbi:MAG: hypothetical protein AB8F65_12580 [Woeseiaceae bacterium]
MTQEPESPVTKDNGTKTPASAGIRIGLLHLVPAGRWGRWICGLLIAVTGLIIFGVAAWMARNDPSYLGRFFAGSTSSFFVAIVAYIVPVFHFITEKTHQAITDLERYLPGATRVAELHNRIERKPVRWVLRVLMIGFVFWLLQSYLLAGSWRAMWFYITDNYVSFVMSAGPLLVWLTMTLSMSALADNARVLRDVAKTMDLDILDTASFQPLGKIAVYSTLVILGAQALLPIMWINGPISPWTTLPAVVVFTPLLLMTLLRPVLPLRKRLRQQKSRLVAQAQAKLNEARQQSPDLSDRTMALVSYRNAIGMLPEWPFDNNAVARFIVYVVIVPLTWSGAALIEMLINFLLE